MGYSRPTLVDVRGRAVCYPGPTLGPLLEGLWVLLWDHFGKSAITLVEVLWKAEVPSS